MNLESQEYQQKRLSRSRLVYFMTSHITLLLVTLFILSTVAIIWHLTKLSQAQVQLTAVENSKLYSEALVEFRALYTSEVVATAKKFGLNVSHSYKGIPNTIPLPSTLSMLLGNRLGGKEGGVKSKLYSNYPFPWRQVTGGLTDSFSREAWETLSKNPKEPFYRFEDVDGMPSLRYSVADVMKQSCVDCHNSYPNTPKDDWQVGQVRGVLEVVTAIGPYRNLARKTVQQTLYILAVFLLISLTMIGLTMRWLRLRSDEASSLAHVTVLANEKLEKEVAFRQHAEDKLRELTLTDPLTRIANRRKFDDDTEKEWRRALRNKTSMAIIIADIDYFKAYNDHYGHLEGDKALCEVAHLLEGGLSRACDLAARFGGEEFVILLPETDLKGALKVAESLRKSIENAAIVHEYSSARSVLTISSGTAVLIPDTEPDIERLIKEADTALYMAKSSGRNCVNGSPSSNVTRLIQEKPS